MKKIGFLVLAIVLAIGSLGIGYAAWTDTLYINGTVNTGEVNIDAEYFSGTTVYKEIATGVTFEYMWVEDASGALMWENMTEPSGAAFFEVASAGSAPGATEDHVDMTFTDLYPYDRGGDMPDGLMADFIIHNSGTVPVMVEADIFSESEYLAWLWDNGYVTVVAYRVTIVDDPQVIDDFSLTFGDPICGPIQMEPCNYAKVMLYIDLPQWDDEFGDSGYTQDSFMGLTNQTFTGTIYAIQWNEYEPGWWD